MVNNIHLILKKLIENKLIDWLIITCQLHYIDFIDWLIDWFLFSCFSTSYIRTLTFDIILSTAFGVQSECQTNPDDSTMLQVRDAIRFGPGALTIIALALLLPYGTKLLKLLSPWLFKNFQGIKNVADQVIRTSKEKTERTERVGTDILLYRLSGRQPYKV